jgi:hypothetical protein
MGNQAHAVFEFDIRSDGAVRTDLNAVTYPSAISDPWCHLSSPFRPRMKKFHGKRISATWGRIVTTGEPDGHVRPSQANGEDTTHGDDAAERYEEGVRRKQAGFSLSARSFLELLSALITGYTRARWDTCS